MKYMKKYAVLLVAIAALSTSHAQERGADLLNLFQGADKDGDGLLSQIELGSVLEQLRIPPRREGGIETPPIGGEPRRSREIQGRQRDRARPGEVGGRDAQEQYKRQGQIERRGQGRGVQREFPGRGQARGRGATPRGRGDNLQADWQDERSYEAAKRQLERSYEDAKRELERDYEFQKRELERAWEDSKRDRERGREREKEGRERERERDKGDRERDREEREREREERDRERERDRRERDRERGRD